MAINKRTKSDELMNEAMQVSQKKAIKNKELIKLMGKIHWFGNLDEMRRND